MKTKIIIHRDISRDGHSVWICRKNYQNNEICVAKPVQLEFESKNEGWLLPEPTLFIPKTFDNFWQELASAMIEAGKLPERIDEKEMVKNADYLKTVIDRLLDKI